MTKSTSEKPCVGDKPVTEAMPGESAVRKETAGSIIGLGEIVYEGENMSEKDFFQRLRQTSRIGRMTPDERRKYFEEIVENNGFKGEDAKEYVELFLLLFEQDLTEEQKRKGGVCRLMNHGFDKSFATEYVELEAIPEDQRTPEQQEKYLEMYSKVEWIFRTNDFCLDYS